VVAEVAHLVAMAMSAQHLVPLLLVAVAVLGSMSQPTMVAMVQAVVVDLVVVAQVVPVLWVNFLVAQVAAVLLVAVAVAQVLWAQPVLDLLLAMVAMVFKAV
jgi:hypothetical protein